MTDYKYAVAVAELEDNGALHPYEHMFFMQMQGEHAYTISAITTQLSLKAGLKEWGNVSPVTFSNDVLPYLSGVLEIL